MVMSSSRVADHDQQRRVRSSPASARIGPDLARPRRRPPAVGWRRSRRGSPTANRLDHAGKTDLAGGAAPRPRRPATRYRAGAGRRPRRLRASRSCPGCRDHLRRVVREPQRAAASAATAPPARRRRPPASSGLSCARATMASAAASARLRSTTSARLPSVPDIACRRSEATAASASSARDAARKSLARYGGYGWHAEGPGASAFGGSRSGLRHRRTASHTGYEIEPRAQPSRALAITEQAIEEGQGTRAHPGPESQALWVEVSGVSAARCVSRVPLDALHVRAKATWCSATATWRS